MLSFRIRVFVVLAAIPVGLLVLARTGDLPTPSGDSTGPNPLDRPAIRVLEAPEELDVEQSGTVELQAEPPARPGDRVILRTAGTYGLGYNNVHEGVLDADLRATLTVNPRSYLGSFNYWITVPATGEYQEGKSATFAVDIVEPGAPVQTACGRAQPRKADGTAWVCTYSDEFLGTSLDRRYWYPQRTEKSKFTTGTKTRYACAYDGPETIAVRGGNLELSLVDLPKGRDCGKGKFSKYVFGQVMHFQTFAQTYGKYEVRAKIPEIGVPGSQQSFWLWPKKNKYGGWPASGEIDFAEMYSSVPGLDKPMIHYLPGETQSGTNKNVRSASCAYRPGEFNTYGLEWEPGVLTVLLNDEICFVNEYSSIARGLQGRYSPFDQPFYLSLNQAMGTAGNEYVPDDVPDTVTTQIDYVRIWQ